MVDAEAGTLQLSRSLLLALGAFSGGATGRADPPSGVTVKALRAAGMLGPTGLHDMLVPIAAAVADPLVRIAFDHLGPGPATESPGWITPDVTVLAVPGEDGLDEILSFGTSFLVARLAALVGLGPRPGAAALPGSLKADPGLLEGGAHRADRIGRRRATPSRPGRSRRLGRRPRGPERRAPPALAGGDESGGRPPTPGPLGRDRRESPTGHCSSSAGPTGGRN